MWLEDCGHNHEPTRSRTSSLSLNAISLIDTETDTLVKYPESGCEYMALSYVWGKVVPPKVTRDQKLPPLPTVIRDAMHMTRRLRRRYLWVDCICIDQSDEDDKARQIPLMANIYRGAHATIVSLCGSSMADGLTRVVPGTRTPQPQLSCAVRGRQLIGIMPGLDTMGHSTRWGSRAWTLQEAFLSPRNIFVTDYQIYLECNATQCCESLDRSKSLMHLSRRTAAFTEADVDGSRFGKGVYRNFIKGIHDRQYIVNAYGPLQMQYTSRDESRNEQ
jgi:hypothetical protein